MSGGQTYIIPSQTAYVDVNGILETVYNNIGLTT